MQFSNPIWLWGLLGLTVPIAIHLLSRKEGKTIKIGSIRHLEESATTKFKSLRLNEYLLLFVRCLVIVLLTFVLSGLQFKHFKQKEKWLVLEPGMKLDARMLQLTDSLTASGFISKWLQNDFPSADAAADSSITPDYWTLMQQLASNENLEEAVVVSHSSIKGFRGKQISMPENIRWIMQQPEEQDFILSAVKINPDTILIRKGSSYDQRTLFENEFISSANSQAIDNVTFKSPDTIAINVAYDNKYTSDKEIIVSALHVIDDALPLRFDIKTYTTDTLPNHHVDWTVWLSNKNMPAWVMDHIRFDTTAHAGELLLRRHPTGKGNEWLLTKRLTSENVIASGFAVSLALILSRDYIPVKTVQQHDSRTMPEALMWRAVLPDEGEAKNEQPLPANTTLLAGILTALIMFERYLAYKRNQ